MTTKQKHLLASALLAAAGELVEYSETADLGRLKDIPRDEIAKQLGVWLNRLPGDEWDARLTQP